MPPTQCCCSPSFGLKASSGDFRSESCFRKGTVSSTEPLPLCPLRAPARWCSPAVRAAHGGTPGAFRSPALRTGRGRRGSALYLAQLRRHRFSWGEKKKKKRKGMGRSPLGHRRGWDPSGGAHLLQAILRALSFPGISLSNGSRQSCCRSPCSGISRQRGEHPNPAAPQVGMSRMKASLPRSAPGRAAASLGLSGGAWRTPEILQISRTPQKS